MHPGCKKEKDMTEHLIFKLQKLHFYSIQFKSVGLQKQKLLIRVKLTLIRCMLSLSVISGVHERVQ